MGGTRGGGGGGANMSANVDTNPGPVSNSMFYQFLSL